MVVAANSGDFHRIRRTGRVDRSALTFGLGDRPSLLVLFV
jgi:hypothetical protein